MELWDSGTLAVMGVEGGDIGEGGGGFGTGGSGGGDFGGGGDGGSSGGGGGGAQPGANTPCAPHASGHITAKVSVKDKLAGGLNSTPPACDIRANWLTGKAQSFAGFSPSESSKPRNKLSMGALCSNTVAQPSPLDSTKPVSITMSVHGDSCGVGGGVSCGGCCGG